MKIIMRFRWFAATALFAGLVAAADALAPPPLHRAEDVSALALDRNGQWLHAFATDEGRWRFQADLDAIDPVFVERLIAIEDKRFYAHWGVDPLAVMRAGASAVRSGEIVSGASTITMQTARLLEPRPRTIGAKLIEMLRALQIERRLSKHEILELYLTLAPYGGNIEGVRAASLLYFDKEPVRLTDAEQALLIALPQAPEARRPDLRGAAAAKARKGILHKLAASGALTPLRAQEAGEAALPDERYAFRRLAYHAAHRLSSAREGGTFITTLDAALQAQAEAALRAYVANHAEEAGDGATAALLIVENDTRAVRAAVGSSGLDAEGGWIDLTRAARSPGSALKPFIYALAFEDGLAGPSTVIDDMPRSFGGYSPENFDRSFRGEVRLREALQHSLNLPAVRALERVGAARFSATLHEAGVNLKTPARADEKPGLTLALGGAGVTAQELAVLYAALGDDGTTQPLRWTQAEENGVSQKGYRLMSPVSAERISAILADAPSLEGRAPAHLSRSALRVAFKTGTSYGYRDAWAAGHGGGHTVIVWAGRADGAARPGQTGRRAAAPLMFEVFDMLERHGERSGPLLMADESGRAGAPLARLDAAPRLSPPEIVFPRHGVEVYLSAQRGFALAARGGAAGYQWYVNGELLPRESTSGRALWRPDTAGFYNVTVVDAAGRRAQSKVRVIAG